MRDDYYKEDLWNPPKRWYFPLYGNGLKTTGTKPIPEDGSVCVGDCGDVYGYCYQPQIFQKSSFSEFYTTTTLSVHGFNPKLQDKHRDAAHDVGIHPFFDTAEKAINWLKERGLVGEVIRYAHHKALEDRGPYWEYEPIFQKNEWKQYRPWITAGSAGQVTNDPNVAYGGPLTLLGGIDLHCPDGSVKHVGGSRAVVEKFMDDYESRKEFE